MNTLTFGFILEFSGFTACLSKEHALQMAELIPGAEAVARTVTLQPTDDVNFDAFGVKPVAHYESI